MNTCLLKLVGPLLFSVHCCDGHIRRYMTHSELCVAWPGPDRPVRLRNGEPPLFCRPCLPF